MDHSIRRILQIILTAARSQVPISVPVALEVAIDRRCQCVAPYIELPILVE